MLGLVLGVFGVLVTAGVGFAWILELAAPDFLDLFDLVLAELEPAGHVLALILGQGRDAALFVVALLVTRLLIQLLLSEVAQSESNLGDLTHVGARASSIRWEREEGLTLEFNVNELLKQLHIRLHEAILHGLQHSDALSMGK